MQTVVLCGFKGGTARTSTSLHLGSALASMHKKKVLLVDFDPQANLSTGLGFGTDSLLTMVPVLQGERSMDEVIQPTHIDGLHIVPANTYLDQIESTAPLVSDPYAHERLRKALKPLNFDFCFIDIPPSLGWLCQSAFFADSSMSHRRSSSSVILSFLRMSPCINSGQYELPAPTIASLIPICRLL